MILIHPLPYIAEQLLCLIIVSCLVSYLNKKAFKVNLSTTAILSLLLAIFNTSLDRSLDLNLSNFFDIGLFGKTKLNDAGFIIYSSQQALVALFFGIFAIVRTKRSKGEFKGFWVACAGSLISSAYLIYWAHFFLTWTKGMAAFGGSS